MKNRRIWIVILLILITGMISTSYTKRYVREQEQTTVTVSEPDLAVDAAPVAEIEAGSNMIAVPEAHMEVAPETVAAPMKREALVPEGAPSLLSTTSALKRLEELDLQIEKNHITEKENTANYSVKVRVENERKLWEAEVENIVTMLNERLNPDKQEALAKEQREWYRERETKAIEASRKQSTSLLEEVEYTRSLVSSTRERAYELVQAYEQVLEY